MASWIVVSVSFTQVLRSAAIDPASPRAVAKTSFSLTAEFF